MFKIRPKKDGDSYSAWCPECTYRDTQYSFTSPFLIILGCENSVKALTAKFINNGELQIDTNRPITVHKDYFSYKVRSERLSSKVLLNLIISESFLVKPKRRILCFKNEDPAIACTNFLKNNFTTPIIQEWSQELFLLLSQNDIIHENGIGKIESYYFGCSEWSLDQLISNNVKNGKLKF